MSDQLSLNVCHGGNIQKTVTSEKRTATLYPIEEICEATNYMQDISEESKIRMLSRFCARKGKCITIGCKIVLPLCTEETVQKINGVNNAFLEEITEKTNIDLIWYSRKNNEYLFWGPTERSVIQAILQVQEQIKKNTNDEQLPQLSLKQALLLEKIEQNYNLYQFKCLREWKRNNKILFRPDEFLQTFVKEAHIELRKYSYSLEYIKEMRAKNLRTADGTLLRFPNDSNEEKFTYEKENLSQLVSKVRAYLLLEELPVEIYIE